MYIINKSARLIDFSFDKVKYRLMPAGNAVEVPNKAMDSVFLEALIKEGSVKEVENLKSDQQSGADERAKAKKDLEAKAMKDLEAAQKKADDDAKKNK